MLLLTPMTRTLTIVALAFSAFFASPTWGNGAVLYGADGAQGNPSSLRILNPATGALVSTVGPIGFAVTGLAVHPTTGVLYGSTAQLSATAPRSLITIDKGTGLGTLVGSFGLPGHTMADLTFGPDGTLYGWAEPDLDALHRINLTTGQATRVGQFSIGVNTLGSGIAANADVIFLAGREGRGPLYTVNRTNGIAGAVAFLDWRPRAAIGAMAFAPSGVLFGAGLPIDSGPVLVTINVLSGHVTEIGPTVDFLDAIAFDPPTFPPSPARAVPTLSQAAFVAMAVLLTAVALYRMRRRGAFSSSAASR